MKTSFIEKNFKTIKEAEKFQVKLLEKYQFVRLSGFPLYSENGVYSWLVGLDR